MLHACDLLASECSMMGGHAARPLSHGDMPGEQLVKLLTVWWDAPGHPDG